MNQQGSTFIAGALVALTIATTSPAYAQAPLPQPQMQGDVAFLNGGAGDEEVQFIKQSMKDYSMALAFARSASPRAEYVASVALTIKDAKGKTVFESPSVGPYLLVKLPAGKYSVVATYHDVTETRPVSAGQSAGPLTTFTWQ